MLAAPTLAPEYPDGPGGRDVSSDPRCPPPVVRLPVITSQAADERDIKRE